MMDNEMIKEYDNNIFSLIKDMEKEFVQLINARLGIVIKSHQLEDMRKTILQGCNQFNCSPENYLKILKHGADNSPELEYLVTGITVGETYFFRDARQIKLLHEIVLPKIIQSKREQNNLSLRIWSAGCSS